MERKVEQVRNWFYPIFIIFIIWAFFTNGIAFVNNNYGSLILISLGFLTFVSVFFGFIYYSVGRKFNELIKINLDEEILLKAKRINEISKNYHGKKDLDNLKKVQNELETLENTKGNVDAEKWLFCSIFSWFLLIISSTVDRSFVIPKIDFAFLYVVSFLFYLSILFTSFLIISILIWTLNYRFNKNKRD